MKAYIINTYREERDFMGIDIFETFPVAQGPVTALYVPKFGLFGIWNKVKDDEEIREFIFSTESPYLRAQEIVDGKREGLVTKIELDNDKKMKILGILERLYNPKKRESQESIWWDTRRMLNLFYLQGLSQQHS